MFNRLINFILCIIIGLILGILAFNNVFSYEGLYLAFFSGALFYYPCDILAQLTMRVIFNPDLNDENEDEDE